MNNPLPTPTVRVRIELFGGVLWDINVLSEKLHAMKGLPSGEVFHLERKVGDVQTERVLIRPYYRRVINGELHVFAVQVMAKEGKRHGK